MINTKRDYLNIEEYNKYDIVLCNSNKYNKLAKFSLEYIWDNNKSNIGVLELLIQFSYLSEDQDITKIYLEDLLHYDSQNEFAIMMLAEINLLNQDFFLE